MKNNINKVNTVAVLFGGPSSEAEISKLSATNIQGALSRLGYTPMPVELKEGWVEELKLMKPDFVFNGLHGVPGEDGSVQGVLELLGFPYQGSGILASALAMDKSRSKEIFKQHGLDVAAEQTFTSGEMLPQNMQDLDLKPPFVLKPTCGGSSVGVYLVMEEEDWENVYAEMHSSQEALLLEEFIAGREMTVAVLGGEALAVTEILTKGEQFYNYKAKYAAGGSSHTIPAEISVELERSLKEMSEKAHCALGCLGLTRADFRVDSEKGRAVILEINTLPGMTGTSLAPEQAAHKGMDFDALIQWMIKDALQRFELENARCCL